MTQRRLDYYAVITAGNSEEMEDQLNEYFKLGYQVLNAMSVTLKITGTLQYTQVMVKK